MVRVTVLIIRGERNNNLYIVLKIFIEVIIKRSRNKK